jgi:predicted aldo/keto reductase-like oxidoreductase
MGPVGGGRLSGSGPDFTRLIAEELGDAPTLALNFVWSNHNVTCALSGMETTEILEKNVRLAEKFSPLSGAEYEKIRELQARLEGLREFYCSGCGYCMPCEQDVNIPGIFNLYICHEIFSARRYARDFYSMIGILPHLPGKNAAACIECGECEEKCPQKIPIVEQLKKAHELMSSQ